MNDTGVTGRFYHPILTLSMRVFDSRDFMSLVIRQTLYIISREISIEHPSVGLASLAQQVNTKAFKINAKIEDVGLNED